MEKWYNININERINIYTDNSFHENKLINIDKNKLLGKEDKQDHADIIILMNVGLHLTSDYIPYRPGYWKQRGRYENDWSGLKIYNNKNFFLQWGDSTRSNAFPHLCKVRKLENPHNKILMRFNNHRHWGNVKNITSKRCYNNFSNKKSLINWRGATTGHNFLEDFRLLVTSKYYNNKYCDIGFSKICQHKAVGMKDEIQHLVKSPQTASEMLTYKYLLSLDGNDKASDINWKLASDSVVFMTTPIYESWLMESKLQPWVHYIPLKNDFSDLIEKFEWAEKNEGKCVEIIKNANLFMDSNFGDEKREKDIERLVLKCYLDNTEINLV